MFTPQDFEKECLAFHRRVEAWKPLLSEKQTPASPRKIGIVVMPWMWTAVPLLSIEIAHYFKWLGHEVQILVEDDEPLLNDYPHWELEREAIGKILSLVSPEIPQRRIFASPPSRERKLRGSQIDLICFEQAVQKTYSEALAHELLAKRPGLHDRVARHYQKIAAAIAGLDLIFIPGGVFGASLLYNLAARDQKIRPTSYDTGVGGLYLCENGIAAQLDELRNAAALFSDAFIAEKQKKLRASFDFYLQERQAGRIVYFRQHFPKSETDIPCDVLLCLNYRAETGALVRQKLFQSVDDWVLAVMRWCKIHQKHLVVRHHPVEKDMDQVFTEWGTKGKLDDYGWMKNVVDPEGQYIHLARGGDPVNTYDLLEKAKVILPYVSRIGLEAAVMGKEVILPTECFYDSWGCAKTPESQREYFSLLSQAFALEKTAENPAARSRALLCCFLLERGCETPTQTMPLFEFCQKWREQKPEELWTASEKNELPESLKNMISGKNYCFEKAKILLG